MISFCVIPKNKIYLYEFYAWGFTRCEKYVIIYIIVYTLYILYQKYTDEWECDTKKSIFHIQKTIG